MLKQEYHTAQILLAENEELLEITVKNRGSVKPKDENYDGEDGCVVGRFSNLGS